MAHTRQQQQQTTGQQAFLHDNDNQSFPKGLMHVDGVPQQPIEAVHWKSTNGLTTYTTVTWQDPATGQKRTSCNCPGWTIKKRDRRRECKHTLDMEGVAVCRDDKADTVRITSAEVAKAAIPALEFGKELRGFTF